MLCSSGLSFIEELGLSKVKYNFYFLPIELHAQQANSNPYAASQQIK
jgi:hypothetical protein